MPLADYIEPGMSPWTIAAMDGIPDDDTMDGAPDCWVCGDDGTVPGPDGRPVPCDHRNPRRRRDIPDYMRHQQPTPREPLPVPMPDPRVDVPPAPF